MKPYLVLGASGLLGINLSLQLSEKHEVVVTFYQTQINGTPFRAHRVDLSKPDEANRLIEAEKPGVIINCAALANIDVCENEPELADQLNVKLPAELARAACRMNIKLVHISTDAVFDGKRGM